jgi:hypothetical protein
MRSFEIGVNFVYLASIVCGPLSICIRIKEQPTHFGGSLGEAEDIVRKLPQLR